MAKAQVPNLGQRRAHSITFYRRMITNFVSNSGIIERENIGKILSRPKLGRLNFFLYDPKLKEILPYYDKFPLVIPLNYYPDGFLGLNIHYLPEGARLAFFEQLLGTQNNYFVNMKTYLGYNTGTALTVNYPMLKNVGKYSAYEVCIKRYLYSHLKSPFLDINPPNWELMVTLPVAKWSKSRPY